MFSKTEIKNLFGAGLIKKHTGSGAYVLTGKGGSLLDEAFAGEVLPQVQREYRLSSVQRRLYIARLVMAAYRASVNVFTTCIEDLCKDPAIFLPSNTRGRGANPWVNTRIAAVASLGGTVCAVHYVYPGIGGLLFSDELAVFARNITPLKAEEQAFIFFGDSYEMVLAELEHVEDLKADRLVCYGEAYQQLSIPAYLFTGDDTGVTQLRIMSVPGYRAKLTRIALKSKFTPPPEDFPLCDALFGGVPFLIAADMDLRRIDAAVAAASRRNCGPIVLAALEAQADAILYARYRDTGKARVFTLTASALEEFFGSSGPAVHSPSHGPFFTAKGGVIDAPLIKTH